MKVRSHGSQHVLLVAIGMSFTVVAHARNITIVNNCSEQVCPGVYGTDPSKVYPNNLSVPLNGGFCMAPGTQQTVSVLDNWSNARIWGRRGCNTSTGHCDTGDCGNKIACNGATGVPPATLAEFNFRGYGDEDYYDISLVDGSDLTMAIHQTTATSTSNPYWCGNPVCATDMNSTCPAELRLMNGSGVVVGCMSYCTKYNTPEYCCTGAYSTPATCPAYAYSRVVKAACPEAYSFAYDDQKSTYTCNNPFPDYTITFCPNAGPTAGAIVFDSRDRNAASPAEWDTGYYKGDCGSCSVPTGLSQRTDLSAAHALLCAPNCTFTGSGVTTLSDIASGDHRRASRASDWDSGYYKSECGLNEYVSGISMEPSSKKLHGLRCASASLAGGGVNNCETRLVTQDDRGDTAYGDWDYGYLKAQCSPGKVIYGVSTVPTTGMPHRILCCSF